MQVSVFSEHLCATASKYIYIFIHIHVCEYRTYKQIEQKTESLGALNIQEALGYQQKENVINIVYKK